MCVYSNILLFSNYPVRVLAPPPPECSISIALYMRN